MKRRTGASNPLIPVKTFLAQGRKVFQIVTNQAEQTTQVKRILLTTKGSLEIGCWVLDIGILPSQLNIQHPTSNIQHPTSNVQCPMSNVQVEESAAHVLRLKVGRGGLAAP
jgi:hypothetical protein